MRIWSRKSYLYIYKAIFISIPELYKLSYNCLHKSKVRGFYYLVSRQSSSVAYWCPTLCDPMDPIGILTQTHAHQVGDATQPSVVPFSCLQSFPASVSFPISQFFIRWPKYWSFRFSISLSIEYSGLISFGLTGLIFLLPKGLESSPAPQFKSISSSGFSLLFHPTLTSIHDYWKNHSFD